MTNPTDHHIDEAESILGHNHHKRLGGKPCLMAKQITSLIAQEVEAAQLKARIDEVRRITRSLNE